MKIAVLGAGNVGQALGEGLNSAGHRVIYGVRDPEGESARVLVEAGKRVAPLGAAAKDSEAVIISLPWKAVESVLRELGDFGGRILIDATNPIGPGFQLTHGHSDSGAEQVARWAPAAKVVKAFNTNGVEIMRRPQREEGAAWMPVCGDDEEAVKTTAQLAEELGYDVITYPSLDVARLLEPLTLLWIKSAGRVGSREIALRLMRGE